MKCYWSTNQHGTKEGFGSLFSFSLKEKKVVQIDIAKQNLKQTTAYEISYALEKDHPAYEISYFLAAAPDPATSLPNHEPRKKKVITTINQKGSRHQLTF